MKTRLAALVCTLAVATPLAAEDTGPYYPDAALCQAMFRFAESARTHSRSVRLRSGRRAIAARVCEDGGNRAGREVCELLKAGTTHLALPLVAQNALYCIGIGEPALDDPDAIGNAWWTRGDFKSEPPHFAEGKVRLEIAFDGRRETSRQWISVTAIPIR